MDLPGLAADALRQALPFPEAEIEMDEIEGRADPGDGRDHVDPPQKLTYPLGNLGIDHADGGVAG